MAAHFKAATAKLPIVIITADPVALGLVASLARPGGNITGVVVDAGFEFYAKHLQMLREAVPTASSGWALTNDSSGVADMGFWLNEKRC